LDNKIKLKHQLSYEILMSVQLLSRANIHFPGLF
jgi:hypothetical protein